MTPVQAVILIINADQRAAAGAAGPLERAGYRAVVSAQKECLSDLVALVNPCMVFIDSGCLAGEIRAQRRYARILIVLAGRAISPDERIESLERDVDCCMDESTPPAELVARVQALLRRR